MLENIWKASTNARAQEPDRLSDVVEALARLAIRIHFDAVKTQYTLRLVCRLRGF
jgi:hypothetical protein